jgi:hypothetical protein
LQEYYRHISIKLAFLKLFGSLRGQSPSVGSSGGYFQTAGSLGD